jgi:hypothetical protein
MNQNAADPSGAPGTYDLPDGTQTRVCILHGGGNNDTPDSSDLVSGMIGLMQFLDLEAPSSIPTKRRPGPGDIVIMFGTNKLRELEKRLYDGGFDLDGPPIRLDAPGRAIVYELLGRDPNGVRVAFVQQSEIGPTLV